MGEFEQKAGPMENDQLVTRRRILASARHHFNSPGYNQARVSDIAATAGVSRATVYNHFLDKEALLRELIEEYILGYEKISESMTDAYEEQTAFSVLYRMVRDALMWRVSNADLRPAIDVARQVLSFELQEANRLADDALRKQLAEVHHRSARMAIVRPDIDIDFAATALYGMIETALNSLDVSTEPGEVDRVAMQLTLLQWHAVYTVAPPDAPAMGR